MKKPSFRTIVVIVIALVFLAISAVGGAYAIRAYQRKQEVAKGLDQINAGLPKMIDSITRLDSVHTDDGKEVIYHFTVIGEKFQQITAADLAPLKPQIVGAYCTNPQLALFRDNRMPLKYTYYHEDGSMIGMLVAADKDCAAAL